MNSSKQSRKILSRAVSFIACAALILFAILSFVFLSMPRALADDAAGSSAKENNGIRFVQVAAGSDFAIGLTFDGKLYGWSLDEDRVGATELNQNATTLGGYYTDVPSEIPVIFRMGPGSSQPWSEGVYHNVKTEGRIKSIAATRTTAAFVTTDGYIYTWGYDYDRDDPVGEPENVFMEEMSATQHYLLLRDPGNVGTTFSQYYIPYIINYNYYDTTSSTDYGLHHIAPTVTDAQLVAGEYTYSFAYTKGTTRYLYSWGSLMYNAVNTASYDPYNMLSTTGGIDETTAGAYMSGGGGQATSRGAVALTGTTIGSDVTLVAGGYSVGVIGSSAGGNDDTNHYSSLWLRGKNFLTSVQPTVGDSNTISLTAVTNVAASSDLLYKKGSSTGTQYTVKSAIAGGRSGDFDNTPSGLITVGDVTQYFGRQLTTDQLTYRAGGNLPTNIVNSRGTPLNGDAYNSVVRNAVSLGNEIGYGISGGALYAWGDNSKGQLTAAVEDANKAEPTRILSGITDVVSVAAGKQLSGSTKAFNSYSTLTDENTFGQNITKADAYITGALDNSGIVWVWSDEVTTPQKVAFGNVRSVAAGDAVTVKSSDRFIAIYSGYGHNLFAITATGKLVGITSKGTTGFTTKIYDNFASGVTKESADTQTPSTATAPITNWTIGERTNTVIFNMKTQPTKTAAPTFATVKFYVWADVMQNDTDVVFNGTENDTYASLVTGNNIGDAYNILVDNETLLPGEFGLNGTAVPTSFAPVYKFKGVEMTPKQRANMFTADVGTDGGGTYIQITPKHSSGFEDVTVEFYVGRCANSAEVNPLYYDIKPYTLTFNVQDTPSVLNYDKFVVTRQETDDEGNSHDVTGNSNIPLLDPNNADNRNYSLAVQDVSSGVKKLVEFLGGDSDFETAVINAMNGADAGFPSSAKRTRGNLDYYLGETVAAAKYNDTYQFMFTDYDADRISIALGANGLRPINSGVGNSISALWDHITVSVALPEGNSVTKNEILTDFDNVYGLYDFDVTEADGVRTLTFKYDVLRFTAVGSTGVMSYADNDIKKYDTGSSAARIEAFITASATSTLKDNATPVSILKNDSASIDIASVCSQPSLRLKLKNGENWVYGDVNGGNNEYTVRISTPIPVGSSYPVSISNYFDFRTDRIVFSYNNSVQNLSGFNNQFVDEVNAGIGNIVTLTTSTLTITPTVAKPIDLTVAMQRFRDTGNQTPFAGSAESVYNEKVYVRFIFENITDFTFAKSTSSSGAANSVDGTYTIQKDEIIDILGNAAAINSSALATISAGTGDGSSAADAYTRLVSSIRISNIRSATGTTLFEYSYPGTGGSAITLRPKMSGSDILQFTATVYGKSLFFAVRINVRAETTYQQKISVTDDMYIYVTDLKNRLIDANWFDKNSTSEMEVLNRYRILYNDVANSDAIEIERKYNAIYFTDSNGNEVTPAFISNVIFENTSSNPHLRIIAAKTSVSSAETYYMHVKFINSDTATDYASAQEGTVLEVVVPVVSGKSVVTDYPVTIDCKNPTATEWVSFNGKKGLGTVATIDVAYLLNHIPGVSLDQHYSVFLVSSDDIEVSKYFNYQPDAGKKNVVITPVDNTPTDKTCTVNISVANGDESRVIVVEVSVSGILTVLPTTSNEESIGYAEIWLYSFIIVFGVLAIIFIIRLVVYWKKRADQRAIIKRNQELIRMRDRMHNKANAASREQIVKTKLKMEDPKYAKVFNEMRKNKEEESGIVLDNSVLATTASKKVDKKNKKKKNGKKTVAELKAELEAKRAAFASAQANAQPVNPFENVGSEEPGFTPPSEDFPPQDGDFGAQSIDGGEIIFDASDMNDGM